jgi:hypothetical protein
MEKAGRSGSVRRTRKAYPDWQANTEPCLESRVLAVNPRTLDILAQSGLTRQVLELGRPIHVAYFHWRGKILPRPDLAKTPAADRLANALHPHADDCDRHGFPPRTAAGNAGRAGRQRPAAQAVGEPSWSFSDQLVPPPRSFGSRAQFARSGTANARGSLESVALGP